MKDFSYAITTLGLVVLISLVALTFWGQGIKTWMDTPLAKMTALDLLILLCVVLGINNLAKGADRE